MPITKNPALKPLNYSIKNEEDTAIIDISGYIGRDIWEEWMTGEPSPNTAENLKKQLREISANKIIVNINSPGGDVNDGLMIMDLLQAKDANVITNLQGFSASSASIIAMAGTKRRMSENAFLLVHRIMFGLMGFYNQNSMKEFAADMETLDARLVKIYEKRANISAEEIEALLDEGNGYGRWMDAEEALKYGFIDEIYDPADSNDPDTDHLNAQDTETMKRNVEQLAIQAMHGAELFRNMINKKPSYTPTKERTQRADSANEARTRAKILKLKHEVI